MSVTGPALTGQAEVNRQIERLVTSSVLQGSESLCRLLRYLAQQAQEHPGVAVKEYQIATEVFGRPGTFDPRLDSTVRVQTGRLRSKLAEYYGNPGADDPVIIEIPKGSYALTFHNRTPQVPAVPPPATVIDLPPVAGTRRTETRSRYLMLALICIAVALAGAIAVIVYLLSNRPTVAQIPEKPVDAAPLKAFWKAFIDRPEDPWVVFSNAEFVGRPETGIRYFNPATDRPQEIVGYYTGVGEVLAVHELDRAFMILRHGLRVKPSRLLSLDDVRNNDVIFVGPPSENLPLREIPASSDFVFRRADVRSKSGELAILNVRPKNPDEPKMFRASPTIPLTEDYAIVALGPGLMQPHWTLLLAGISTLGTQGAVEYVCRAGSIEQLLTKLTGSKLGPVVPFEAVLKVKISRGVPMESGIVLLHPRS